MQGLTKVGCNWSKTHFTYKSVQLPSEPPLMDASVQLKELGDGPHREDTLKETLESKHEYCMSRASNMDKTMNLSKNYDSIV